MTDTIKYDKLKDDVLKYVDKEIEHVNDGIDTRLKPLNKILTGIETSITTLDSKVYSPAELREIAYNESVRSQKKFWNNFRWFVGITLSLVVAVFIVGVVSWADLRDYSTDKIEMNTKITKNVDDINTLKSKRLSEKVIERLKEIKEIMEK